MQCVAQPGRLRPHPNTGFAGPSRCLLLAASCAGLLFPSPARGAREIPVPSDLLLRGVDDSAARVAMLDYRNVHSVGDIWLNVTNFGLLGSQPGAQRPWSDAPSAQWPAGSSIEYMWCAGLWVGALEHGDRRVTTAVYDMEFRPGRTAADRMYTSAEGEPGGLRGPAFNPDDDGDGEMDEDPLDGRDNDGDGRFDEDFAAVSNQMFTCVYGDTDPVLTAIYPEHHSLGLSVQQTSMAWDHPLLRNFIGLRFQLTSSASPPVEDVYVGLFADPDIGAREGYGGTNDDMAGFWEGEVLATEGPVTKRVNVSIGYMWDADGDGLQSPGYVGLMFLGFERSSFGHNAQNRRVQPLSMRNFRPFSGTGPFEFGGDPINDHERYQVMEGSARYSLPSSGWPRPALSSRVPNDYRFLVSAGPFGSMSATDTLSVIAALVIGHGFDGMLQAAAQAQLAFDGDWVDADHDPTTGVDGRETDHCGPEETGRIYPVGGPDAWEGKITLCDSVCKYWAEERHINWRQQLRCALRVPAEGCIWIDGDCDRSTGVNGAEALVHWLTQVPPLPPNMRLAARENAVAVYFDNRSEKSIDPLLGFSDFESYRIWRASGWVRPAGSGLDTGPDPHSWVLVGEFDVHGNGIGQDSGLGAIGYTPNVPDYLVEFYREWVHAHPLIEPPVLPGFSTAQLDTALAMARGTRYYCWVDPPFAAAAGADDPPCDADGSCDGLVGSSGPLHYRCDSRRRCRPTLAPPQSGLHYFYGVTATDHLIEMQGQLPVASGQGLQGDPQTNFRFIDPPTNALPPEPYADAPEEIYVVPNPATRSSMAPWTLHPNNDDPSGIKVEFHHLPAAVGKVSVFTLAGDLVKELRFDGRSGNGTVAWDLVSRNGQDVTSGVYLFVVEASDERFKRFTGRFAVIR